MLTKAERKWVRQEAERRVKMAFAVARKLTGRRTLKRKVASLLLTLSTPQLAILAGWKHIRKIS